MPLAALIDFVASQTTEQAQVAIHPALLLFGSEFAIFTQLISQVCVQSGGGGGLEEEGVDNFWLEGVGDLVELERLVEWELEGALDVGALSACLPELR